MLKLSGFVFMIMFHSYQGEKPLSVCSNTMPFKKINSECTNYDDVCTKKDDPDCSLFIKACAQCPNLEGTASSKSNDVKTWVFLTIILLELLMICILFIVIKLKFRRTYKNSSLNAERNHEDSSSNYQNPEINIPLLDGINQTIAGNHEVSSSSYQNIILVKPEKETSNNKDTEMIKNLLDEKTKTIIDQLKPSTGDLEKKINTLTDQVTAFQAGMVKMTNTLQGQIHQMSNVMTPATTPIYPLTIKLPDIKEPIVVNVGILDNAVKIKWHIASKFPNLPDYKSMKLKYNGAIVDDNAYLLPLVGFLPATFICELDKNTSAKDFLILKLHGNRPFPELIQINKKYSIKDTKQNICKLFNVENIVLYKDLVELPDKATIDKCKLQDDDTIRLVASEKVSITVKDIFDGSRSQDTEVTNTNKVATFIESLAKKINSDPTNIILLTDGKYLDPDKFIFEYNLGTGSMITYFCIKKFTGIEIQGDSVATGNGSELFMAINKNKEVILKRFDILHVPNLMKYLPLTNELRRLQLFQCHPRFVRVHGVYKDDKYLYVEMEKLDGKSILEYVDKNKDIPEDQIVKWSKQILEGLKFVHDNCIIYREIKPSNILLDSELNVKITGFDLSRYWTRFGVGDAKGSLGFMAPEVQCNLPYAASADVWSFGAVLIFLFTGLPPIHYQTENEGVITIFATETSQYDVTNISISSDMKVLIEKCMRSDPSVRPTVDELFMDNLLKVVISNS